MRQQRLSCREEPTIGPRRRERERESGSENTDRKKLKVSTVSEGVKIITAVIMKYSYHRMVE